VWLFSFDAGSAIHHTWVTDGLVARPYRNDIRIDIHVIWLSSLRPAVAGRNS
jgi:hypothetical protein